MWFSPEGVGEAAGRAKYGQGRYRFSLRAANLRGIQVVRVASVIKNQAIGLSRRKARTTPDNLLVDSDSVGRRIAMDQRVWGVKAGGQRTETLTDSETLRLEIINQRVALGPGLAGNQRLRVVRRKRTDNLFHVRPWRRKSSRCLRVAQIP